MTEGGVMVEQLERRLLLFATQTGDVVTVRGTTGSDAIRIVVREQDLVVRLGDAKRRFDLAVITMAVVDGRGGDDLVNGSDASLIYSLAGGGGDDTLVGGDGPDTLLGGRGKDNLAGNAGEDSLDGGAGRDTIFGGGGDDSMQAVDSFIDRLDGAGGHDLADGDLFDRRFNIEGTLSDGHPGH